MKLIKGFRKCNLEGDWVTSVPPAIPQIGKLGMNIFMSWKFLFLFGILFLLNLNLISSHFVCGIVEDSIDNVSASWHNVKLYYLGDENNYASCEISPDENKYCCNVEEIVSRNWEVGDEVFLKVSDFSSGYAAGPVRVILTNEAYDIAENMKLEKVINIYNPNKKVIFSNDSELLLNVSFLIPYNFVEIEKNNKRNVLCEDCLSYENSFSGEAGMNYLKIFASSGDEVFSDERSFAILNGFNFSREIGCKKCRNNKVRSKSLVNMNLNLELSHGVEGFLLKEYVPASWEIRNFGGGVLEEFNDDYNLIIWNVSGKDIFVNYSVNSAKVRFRPQNFLFKSELEDFLLSEEKILVYRWHRFFSFWALKNRYFYELEDYGNFLKVGLSHPLVFKSDDENIKGGVFVNKDFNRVRFKIFESDFYFTKRGFELIKSYRVLTNLRNKDVKEVSFEVKIDKDLVEDKSKLKFFTRYNGGWKEINYLSMKEEGEYFYFYFKEDLFRKLWIGEEKRSFFRSWRFNWFRR